MITLASNSCSSLCLKTSICRRPRKPIHQPGPRAALRNVTYRQVRWIVTNRCVRKKKKKIVIPSMLHTDQSHPVSFLPNLHRNSNYMYFALSKICLISMCFYSKTSKKKNWLNFYLPTDDGAKGAKNKSGQIFVYSHLNPKR